MLQAQKGVQAVPFPKEPCQAAPGGVYRGVWVLCVTHVSLVGRTSVSTGAMKATMVKSTPQVYKWVPSGKWKDNKVPQRWQDTQKVVHEVK